MKPDNSRIMTVRELADYLRVHPITIYRQLKCGQLPAFRVGSDWRFDVEAIDRCCLVLPAGGQLLTERFNWYVNPVNFSKTYASKRTGGREIEGIVSRGVVVLQGGTLPEGARVKVRVDDN